MTSSMLDHATRMAEAFRRLEADLEALILLQEQITARTASYQAALLDLCAAERAFSALDAETRLAGPEDPAEPVRPEDPVLEASEEARK
jgi:hypothetical protein